MAAPPQAHLFCLSIRYDVPCPDMCVDPYSSLYTRAIQRNNQSQLKDTITFHILTHRRLNLDVVLFGDVGKLYINPLTSRPGCMPGSRYTGVGVLFFVI